MARLQCLGQRYPAITMATDRGRVRTHRVAAAMCLIAVCSGSIAIGGGGRVGKPPTVVVIDAGHGGKDPGAVGPGGVHEKDVTLALAWCIAREAINYPGLCIVLTRVDDRFLELKERVALGRHVRAAAYVSIHANAAADTAVRGVETYPSDRARYGEASLRLAQALQGAVVSATRSKDRGVRFESFYISRATMPAALLEVGFVTQKDEAQSLQDPSTQRRIAISVLDALSKFAQES